MPLINQPVGNSLREFSFLTKALTSLSKGTSILLITLFVLCTTIWGGPPPPPEKPVVVEKKEANPLCFAGGLICIDTQERMRFEGRNNTFDFNDGVDSLTDDSFLLNRFRIGIAVKPTDWFKFYAQGQDVREWFSDRPNIPGQMGAEGDDNFDLRQCYVQIGPKDINGTIGRQVLLYGDERLIGPGEWTNFTKTFDAAKVRWEQPKFSIDVFASTPVYIFRDQFNTSDLFNGSETHRDLVFAGIYATTTAIQPMTLDFYTLVLTEDNPTFFPQAVTYPGTSLSIPGTSTSFVTLGTRVKSDPKKLHGWEYDGEFAFQAGQVSDLDLLACALHIGGGYTWEKCAWTPRLYFEYNFATGDSNPDDGDIGTFQNLFPSNHNKYGVQDLFAWQNLSSPDVRFRVKPLKQVTLETAFYSFWLANTNDAWYRANGTTRVRPVTPAARDASSYVGSELDLLATYQPLKFLSIWAGYSHFFAGDYLKATGPSDDADYGYVQATITF